MRLFDHQDEKTEEIYHAWASGAKNVLYRLPTGGGKTVVLGRAVADNESGAVGRVENYVRTAVPFLHSVGTGAACVIAHREELVGQISVALAREGVRHRIVAPEKVIKQICRRHMDAVGKVFYDPGALAGVAGVDTLEARQRKTANDPEFDAWRRSVRLWVIDEAHHALQGNKWGRAAALFPKARGLGVSATPERSDGCGLSWDSGGLFHHMVIGPGMRELVQRGRLTDYDIYTPPPALLMSDRDIGSTGDFKAPAVRNAFRKNKSRVIGDVVQCYKQFANGKLGITFVPDVEDAIDTAQAFNDAGVPAAVIHAKTKNRADILRRFERREILQLVNVDIVGEGFDLPAVEVVSMARPTASYALFAQQFGRALRTMDGKKRAIIIDHVGNVVRHARCVREGDDYVIDVDRAEWTLEPRAARAVSDSEPSLKSCVKCSKPFERFHKVCPHCGHEDAPAERSGPQQVEGDLTLLDPAALLPLQRKADEAVLDDDDYRALQLQRRTPSIALAQNGRRHGEKRKAQEALRETIAYWAGVQRHAGHDFSYAYRKFNYQFGTDVLTAQTLGTADAEKLNLKIQLRLINDSSL